MSHGLEASQGGTKHQDQHEEQEEGPKGPLTRLDPTTLGRLWLQEALKWGPRAFQEDPCGAQLAANAIVFNVSWFGSKARWHQAAKPTRRATGPSLAPGPPWGALQVSDGKQNYSTSMAPLLHCSIALCCVLKADGLTRPWASRAGGCKGFAIAADPSAGGGGGGSSARRFAYRRSDMVSS